MQEKPVKPEVARASEAPLPAERAFVVQLRAQPDPSDNFLVGRVEHLASGAAARFGTGAELINFIARVLGGPHGDR